jgi:hypothetical protein
VDRASVDNSLTPAGGRAQGVAFIHGKGRVVVLGEAGAVSAQFLQGNIPFGINAEGNDNRQLLLNIMHWLSGLIPVDRRAAKKAAASKKYSSSRTKSGSARFTVTRPRSLAIDPAADRLYEPSRPARPQRMLHY